MPISRRVVEKKISKIKEMIRRIENMDFSQEQFFDEHEPYQDALVFELIQCVELATDIATHIISSEKLPRPDTHREVFQILGKNKYLSAETAEAMAKAVGFRNIAIHDYDDEKFDIKEVYRDYKDDIRDTKKFCAEVVEILEKGRQSFSHTPKKKLL